MKRFYLLLLITFTATAVFSQQLPSQVQAKRGVFTERLFLKDRWLDRISTDLNTSDSSANNIIPTAKAVADYMRLKSKDTQLLHLIGTLPEVQFTNTAGEANTKTWGIFATPNSLNFIAYYDPGGNYLAAPFFTMRRSGPAITDISMYSSSSISFGSRSIFFTGSLADASSDNMFDFNGAWQTTGSPTAFSLNVTDLASGSNTNIMDLKLSNVSKFRIRKDGLITIPSYSSGGFTGTPAYDLQVNSNGEIIEKKAPKTYTAIINQSGANAPTITVLGTNNIGSIVWTRIWAGQYRGTLTGAFPANKTICLLGAENPKGVVDVKRVSDNEVEIDTSDGWPGSGELAPLADGFLINRSIQILVYP